MTLAASFGAFGIIFGLSALLIHLSTLQSFGVPYLLPFTTLAAADLGDAIVRAPWWALHTRPHFIARDGAAKRQKEKGLKPGPHAEDDGGK